MSLTKKVVTTYSKSLFQNVLISKVQIVVRSMLQNYFRR